MPLVDHDQPSAGSISMDTGFCVLQLSKPQRLQLCRNSGLLAILLQKLPGYAHVHIVLPYQMVSQHHINYILYLDDPALILPSPTDDLFSILAVMNLFQVPIQAQLRLILFYLTIPMPDTIMLQACLDHFPHCHLVIKSFLLHKGIL